MSHLESLLAQVDFLPLGERAALLTRWADRLARRQDDFARIITAATGKPLRLARAEVERGLATLRLTVAEAPRLQPREVDLGDAGRATIHRVPAGPVLAVTPFNFPLNLALHKLAPALLAGCPVLWKPSPKAPGVAEAAVAEFIAAGADGGELVVAQLSDAQVRTLAADPRLAVLSFTGSAEVGRLLEAATTRARVVLELGGNAAVILHQATDRIAAARQIAFGACANAGQSCISVQRIITTGDDLDHAAWRDALTGAFSAVAAGDPWHERVVCGPLIDDAARTRVQRELDGIRARGGRILTGGTWLEGGRTLAPTLVEGLPASDPAVRDRELFAPLAFMLPARDLDHALVIADDTPFGLNAGLYTQDPAVIDTAFARLQIGTLVVNDVPTRRDDRLPYGGMKASGNGREGTLVALETYTVERILWRAG